MGWFCVPVYQHMEIACEYYVTSEFFKSYMLRKEFRRNNFEKHKVIKL